MSDETPLIQPFAYIPALTWEWVLPGQGPQRVCLCIPVIHCSIWCTADTEKHFKKSCNVLKFCSPFYIVLGNRTVQWTDQESCCPQYILTTSFQFPAHKQCYQSLRHRSMWIKKMVTKTKCTWLHIKGVLQTFIPFLFYATEYLYENNLLYYI